MTTHVSAVERVNQYLNEQANLDTLRFITCGSVDDRKSTLIGRMLYEAQLILKTKLPRSKTIPRRWEPRAERSTLHCSLMDLRLNVSKNHDRCSVSFFRQIAANSSSLIHLVTKTIHT